MPPCLPALLVAVGALAIHRRPAATATLRYGLAAKSPGAFQVWLQAEAVNATWLDAETRAALATIWGRMPCRR